MAWTMMGTTILTAIATVILVILLVIYARNLSKVKARFTWGLFIIALVWLVEKVMSLYYYVTMMDYYVPEVSTQVFLLSLLQTIALMVLLKITWE